VGINPAGRFFPWLYTNNGRFYSDEQGRKVGFDSVETRDALRFLNGLIQRQGGADVVEQVGTNVRQNFVAGKFSMVVEADLYPSLLAVDPAATQLQWGIALLPSNQGNSKAKYTTPSRGGHGYSVTSGAKNPEGAWALAKFLTLSDAQCNFMVKEQARVSTLKRCNTAPEVQKRPEFQVFSKLLDAVVSLPFSPGDDKAVAALEKHTSLAILGRNGIEAAIQAAVQEAQFELDEGWKTWRG
jgi:ABC-type glycerol-3-phosphate transport system substrate-binding protein